VLSIKKFGRFAYRTISQIAIEYSRSVLSYSENNNLLQAGHLVPFVNINSKVIDEHLKFNGFSILLFDTIITGEQKQELQNAFIAAFQFIDIKRNENEDAFKKFRVTTSALFLIRPDNYIGLALESVSIAEVKKYLTEKVKLVAVFP
jgi:hypothetical protein